MAKYRKGQSYRHAPAFILLFLARANQYGGALLNAMEQELPGLRADGAVIYRSLQELEDEGAVTSYWETDVRGPARKWYQITARGLDMLAGYKDDIEMRKKNFDYFLTVYGEISSRPPRTL